MPLTIEPKYYPQQVPADPEWNKYAGWMVIAAQQQGLDAFVLSHALLRALWAEERDTSQAAVRIAVADENGYDGAALHALERAPATLKQYDEFSEQAERLGVFGAPTFVIPGHDDLWWGQDRLAFVDRALDRMRRLEP
jgi:2-hydroxychromene-2-carboxylate isomerase